MSSNKLNVSLVLVSLPIIQMAWNNNSHQAYCAPIYGHNTSHYLLTNNANNVRHTEAKKLNGNRKIDAL